METAPAAKPRRFSASFVGFQFQFHGRFDVLATENLPAEPKLASDCICIYTVYVTFEWDDANRDHIAAHGVSTNDCEAALNDANAYTREWPSYEPRWRTVGKSGVRTLIVFWTLRGAAVRVVTAWWMGRRTRV